MYCMKCGAENPDGAGFCASCGQQLGVLKQKSTVTSKVGHAVGNVADKLNEVAGGTGHVELKFRDLFKEVFKKHSQSEADELFVCGSPKTTPSLAEVSAAWPKPWLWARVLLSMVVVFIGLIIMWEAFSNANAIPGLIVVGSFMVPLATMLFFFETNAFRNITFAETVKIFFVGGVLSLIATLAFGNVIEGSGTGDFWPSMLTGLIEEAGKVAAIVFFMSRAKGRNYILNGLLIGAAVGAGFAAFESAGYAFRFLIYGSLENLAQLDIETIQKVLQNAMGYGERVIAFGYPSAMSIIIFRGILAIGGHVAWAAIEGAALAICESEDGFRLEQLTNPVFIVFTVIAIVLHGVWDMNPMIMPKFILLIIAVWIVIAVMLNRGLAQVNELANAPISPQTDAVANSDSASDEPAGAQAADTAKISADENEANAVNVSKQA